MKISKDALAELQKIRSAIDNAYDKLNITLYTKSVSGKVSYSETKPFELVSENFEFISKKIRDLQDSEIVGD